MNILLLLFPPQGEQESVEEVIVVDTLFTTVRDTVYVEVVNTIYDTITVTDTTFIYIEHIGDEKIATTNIEFKKDGLYNAWLKATFYCKEEKFEFDFTIDIHQKTIHTTTERTIFARKERPFMRPFFGGGILMYPEEYGLSLSFGLRFKERLDLYVTGNTERGIGVGFNYAF